jgi:amicyanin
MVMPTIPGTSATAAGTLTAITPTVSPSVASLPVVGDEQVAIKNLEFTPASITVKSGSTVTWTNMDDVPHTVTSTGQPPAAINSPTLQKGDTFRFTFNQAGTYNYICTIHTFMKGTVTVTP